MNTPALLMSVLMSSFPLFDKTCGKSPPVQCHFQNNSYEVGATFVDSCKDWCRCKKEGKLQCTPLCPPQSRPFCGPDFILVVREVPSPDPEERCKCKMNLCMPRPRPLNGTCHFQGKSYKGGEQFIDRSCRGLCRCRSSHWSRAWGISCVSLCPPMGIMCPPGQEKLSYQHAMDREGRCFCEREKCREKIKAFKSQSESANSNLFRIKCLYKNVRRTGNLVDQKGKSSAFSSY